MKKFILILSTLAFTLSFAQSKDADMSGKLKRIEAAAPNVAPAKPTKQREVLIFSRTCGFRHKGGIPAAKAAFKIIGEKLGTWNTTISDDLANFTPENLKKFDCVILNNSTAMCFGEPQAALAKMSKDQQAKVKERSDTICKNLIEYVKNGGGILAVHAAVDCYNYDKFRNREFTDMLGGEFVSHPWYLSNAPETIVIDDPNSPITKGIWDIDAFKVREEIYMLGSSYDRKKCRVLMRIDTSRSPVTTGMREHNYKLRSDGDLATAYIKSFGKGRVAYTTFGHSDNNFLNPQILELYTRMAQFCCGDLKADTTPIPFTNKSVHVPMDTKPSVADIKKLSTMKLGDKIDETLNSIIFATTANDFNSNFRKEIESFILSELESSNGTEEYRAFLCHLLLSAKISSDANVKKFSILLSKIPESAKADLANAIAHFKNKKTPFAKEKELAIPAELPKDPADFAKLAMFLQRNPQVKMPSYMKLESLDENGKARLTYALVERGDDLSEILKLKPQSQDFAVAYALAATKSGNTSHIKNIIEAADKVSPKMRPIVASYIASIKSDDVPQSLLDLIADTKSNAQSSLVVAALSKFDLSPQVAKIFADFDKMSPEMKITALQTADTIANFDVFVRTAKLLPTLDPKTARVAIRTMLKCASAKYDTKMFAAVSEIYPQCDKKTQGSLLRFAALESSQDALELCKNAFSNGLRDQSIKAMGEWKNASAIQPLLAIAKVSKNEQQKNAAQQAAANVALRSGTDAKSLEYILANSKNEEEKSKFLEASTKNPSSDIVDILKKNGFTKEAQKAEDVIKNAKTEYLASWGEKTFPLALDGNPDTRFTTGKTITPNDWIAFDFGYVKNVSEIIFDFKKSSNDFPDNFDVYAGNSAKTISLVKPQIEKSKGIVSLKFPKGFNARFIKLVSTQEKNFYWSIHELNQTESGL